MSIFVYLGLFLSLFLLMKIFRTSQILKYLLLSECVWTLTSTHQETIEKNPSRLQTHINRQTVIDVHKVLLATSAIDSKSRVWSITCPSSHGVGLESSIVVLWYCPSHALCMGKFLIGPTALPTFSHGAPPQDTF